MNSLSKRLLFYFLIFYSLLVAATLYLAFSFTERTFEKSLDSELKSQALVFKDSYESKGLDSLLKEFNDEVDEAGSQDRVFILQDKTNHFHFSKNEGDWTPLLAELLKADNLNHQDPITLENENQSARVLKVSLNDGSRVIVMGSLETIGILEDTFLWIGLGLLITLPVFASIGAYFIMGKLLQRIRRIRNMAKNVEADGTSGRLPIDGVGDEFDELSQAINGLLIRIQNLMQVFKATAENLAHDLRTPLTRLRGNAELVLKQHGENNLSNLVIEETDNLIELINTTLEVASMSSQGILSGLEPISIRETTLKAIELFNDVAAVKNITLESNLTVVNDRVQGSPHVIERVIANIIDNSIKYSNINSSVEISIREENSMVCLSVKDNGCGIPAELISRVHERFFRIRQDPKVSGFGLGLAFVKSALEAHNGKLTINSEFGAGTRVEMYWPLSEENS
jgi:signal transduction histidine kinase